LLLGLVDEGHVMRMWIRRVLGVAAVLVPGGVVVLLGLVVGRALWTGYRAASVEAQGGPVQVRRVLAGLTVRSIVREAFAA
jgi:hypothetical protein